MQNGKRTIEVIRKQSLHTLGPYHRADLLTTLRDFNLNRNASRWGGGGMALISIGIRAKCVPAHSGGAVYTRVYYDDTSP